MAVILVILVQPAAHALPERELVARHNTPVRSDGAGPSGVHDAPPAAADDNACEEPELEYDSEDEEMFWNCIQAERM